MADFEIIEADFQQYYNLDVSRLGFRRYARLLLQLPQESRTVHKYSPFKDWNWDREIQSQILHAVNTLTVMFANANRKKGVQPIKVGEQPQPDYVKKAKKETKENKKENNVVVREELDRFFSRKNNQVKILKEKKDGK